MHLKDLLNYLIRNKKNDVFKKDNLTVIIQISKHYLLWDVVQWHLLQLDRVQPTGRDQLWDVCSRLRSLLYM